MSTSEGFDHPHEPSSPENFNRQQPPDEALWNRVIDASRLLRQFPTDPAIQRYAMAVSTFRITPEEHAELVELCRAAAARN